MKKFLWSFFEVLETVAIAAVVVFLIRSFLAQPFLDSGSSMEPTFYNGDYLLVDELIYRFREPQRGEVIVFRHSGDSPSYFIKRIIGLPNEKVVIEGNRVTIFRDDKQIALNETYIKRGSADQFEVVLDSDEYFVLGDNRGYSFDSRKWGPLKKSQVVGLTRLRLWPLNQVEAFSAPIY